MWTELQEIAETAGWIQPPQLSLADLNPEQAQQSLQTMSPLARRVLTAYLQQGGGQVRASILAEQLGEPLDKVRAALEEINFPVTGSTIMPYIKCSNRANPAYDPSLIPAERLHLVRDETMMLRRPYQHAS